MVVLHVFPSSSAAENCFCCDLPFSLCFTHYPLDISLFHSAAPQASGTWCEESWVGWPKSKPRDRWADSCGSCVVLRSHSETHLTSMCDWFGVMAFKYFFYWKYFKYFQYFWVSLLSTCHNSLYFCPAVLAKLEVGINCCSFSCCTFPRRAVECTRALSWKADSPSFAIEMLRLWTVDSCMSVDCKCRELVEYWVC